MEKPSLLLAPGTLLQALTNTTKRALSRGALHSIDTNQRFIEQDGVRFLVRSVSALARKDRARISEAEKARDSTRSDNPFLPYDRDLFVADISRTHVGLLNKFNVMKNHLLIVTRDFEHQETLLTHADFEALWTCLTEIDSLGFYNGGTAAGASQPHKHLQIAPLPIANEGPAIPMEPLLAREPATGATNTLRSLPFLHVFSRLDPALTGRSTAADILRQRYLHMLDRLALTETGPAGEPQRPEPYNLLVTREWMLLVPRSRECFDSISINALGFAGSLFVRDAEQMAKIKQYGPMAVLRAVGYASNGPLSPGGHSASG